MARRSLKPQLNQIRAWVTQGRTDAWIAHQLEVSVGDLVAFKREHDLAPPEPGDQDGGAEEDLRAQDDALVAAALEAEPEEEPEPEASSDDEGEESDEEAQARRRRRGRRGGRGRRSGGGRGGKALEGTFDHGEEGYGLWLDPAVQDDPVYAEHWAGHRPISVTVERDQIVIRRASADGASPDNDDDGE